MRWDFAYVQISVDGSDLRLDRLPPTTSTQSMRHGLPDLAADFGTSLIKFHDSRRVTSMSHQGDTTTAVVYHHHLVVR